MLIRQALSKLYYNINSQNELPVALNPLLFGIKLTGFEQQ